MKMTQSNKFSPFNNNIDMGLRALSILQFAYPKSYDLSKLVFLDYMTVHSGDFNSPFKSLHAPVPNRKSEVYIRRSLLEQGLLLFSKYGLVIPEYLPEGVFYIMADSGEPFLDSLGEDYTTMLKLRTEWVVNKFGEYSAEQLKKIVSSSNETSNQEIAFDVEFIMESK
jgi:hypothetical protein